MERRSDRRRHASWRGGPARRQKPYWPSTH
jgi:hypothetical protein